MSKKLVEVLVKQLKYSPNGWDNALAILGEEIYLSEGAVRGLMALDPPMVGLVDENFEPSVFHNDNDILEDALKDEDVADEEVVAIEEAEIEATIANEEKEEVVSLEELEKIVDEAPDGADEIEIDVIFTAVQKSGKWYNILKLDEKVNDKGVARDKVAKYIYDLYNEGV